MTTHTHVSNPCTICGFPLKGDAAREFVKDHSPGIEIPGEQLNVRKINDEIIMRKMYRGTDGLRHTEFERLYTQKELDQAVKEERKIWYGKLVKKLILIERGELDLNEYQKTVASKIKLK